MTTNNIPFKTAMALTIGIFSFLISNAQTANKNASIQFPQSFKLDGKLLAGMHIQPINKEVKEALKINENPGMVCNEEGIQRLMSSSIEDAKCVYYELYHDKAEDDGDAGIRVIEFNSEDGMQRSVDHLTSQNNTSFLTKDKYLIALWSDDSRNSEKQLADMTSYYQNKIGAKVYIAKASEDIIEVQAAEGNPVPGYDDLIMDSVKEDPGPAIDAATNKPVKPTKKKKK